VVTPLRAIALLAFVVLIGAAEGSCSGSGDDGPSGDGVDVDGDGYGSRIDCNDGNADIHPGADERCNGLDDDCDGEIDEEIAVTPAWYPDEDRDGWGGIVEPSQECPQPVGLVATTGDCDDYDPGTHPEADERCDGRDQDCDGVVDEEPVDGTQLWTDADGDGWGEPGSVRQACEPPLHAATRGGDCDDGDPRVSPGHEEICCNQDDDDCDGRVDQPCSGDVAVFGVYRRQQLGIAMAAAGDMNGDGLGDLLVGAKGGIQDDRTGSAYLVYGASGLAEAKDEVVSEDMGAALLHVVPGFGSAVAGLGDIDGDGHPDIAIGAPNVAEGAQQGGAVLLFSGPVVSGSDAATASAVILGRAPFAHLGTSVAAAGDLNGDSRSDLLVGTPHWGTHEGASLGVAAVYLGPITGELSLLNANLKIVGQTDQRQVGSALCGPGDLDGDGLDDWLVAYDTDQGGNVAWVSGVLTGELTISDLTDRIESTKPGVSFGAVLAPAGDVDNDGLADFLVGVPEQGSRQQGIASLFTARVSGAMAPSSASAHFTGRDASENQGTSVAGDFDWDADGWLDVLVGGQRGEGPGCRDSGGLGGLWLGPHAGTRTTADAERVFVGVGDHANLGQSAAAPGDVDGDGFDDVVLGAPGFDHSSPNTGALWIAFGGVD
jgi:hypothetical protein